MKNNKRAVILAGGTGTRLRPYTYSLPKPLVPVGNMPVLEIIIRQLKMFGFSHITLAVNHMSEIIKAFFEDGRKWGIKIDYSVELKRLGTMGPLTRIKDLPDDFLVMNGDIISDLDYEKFFNFHKRKKSIFTISSFVRDEIVDYGVLGTSNGCLMEISEKPVMRYEVSMGIYMASKKVVDLIPRNKEFGFDQLMIKLLASKKEVYVRKHNKYWLDIGRPSDYSKAIEDYESKIKKYFL